MSELHILDAGRADCTVLLLDTPQGRQTVVVDGGGKYYGARRPLLEFLTQRNISDIDLLILTHLHQDHFGGFVGRCVGACALAGVRQPDYGREVRRLLHRVYDERLCCSM